MASWFKITAALVILLVCIPCLLANDSPWTTPPVAEPWGLSQQSPAIPGSQPQVNPTAQSSLDSQPSNQTLSRASPPVPSESFAHSPVESQPPLTQPSVSTAGPPISQPSAEPLAQQPPPLPAPPQVAPAGSGSGTSSGEQNAGSGESKSGAGEALPAPPSPQAAPPPSPVGPEGVSGAPAEPKGGVEAWDEEAGQVELSVTCGLTDYVRQSGSCDGKGWRIVSFVKIRNCTDPFKVQPMRQEPCTCTPEDFDVTYSISDDGTKCNMQYLPANCTGAQQSAFIPVDMVYCGLASAPCTVGDMDAIYSDCDFIRHPLTGQAISDTPVVEVIYYFGRECDPYRRGSIRLPPSTYIPCDMQCGVGHYLRHDHCLKCPAGTYSMGGKWRFEEIYEIDPKYFKTECKFTNATGAFDCDPWYADDGAFEAGAYDYINDWLPEVCASDAAYNCHNNLRSSLSLDVNLVRDGYVKFNFTVSAEMGHDGLSFYIDSLAEPLMALTSYQFEPREMVFPVEAGQHRLVWEYSKDSKWSKGEDVTTIPYIEVDGVAFNDFHCLPCPPGSHSGEGAAACLPCPDNTFSKERASECTPCGSSTYSRIIPRTECKPRPSCSIERDATIAYTPCQLASKKRTMRWQWIQPQICDPTNVSLPNDTPLDCEPCPDGQQAEPDPQSGEIRCTLCPPGTARQASYEGGAGGMLDAQCEACEAGQVAMKTLSLKHFAMQHNGALPPGFTTGCHGDCGTFGWRAFQDHLDSGSGHGPSATIWLALDVRMAVRGYMTFNYSVDILPGDPGRAFFFFIDHDLMDYVEQQRVEWEGGGEGEGYEHPGAAEDEARMSGMWELDAGNHTVMWVWQKLHDTGAAARTTRDSAVIYEIQIEGVAEGGAARCEEVPQGSVLAAGGDSYVPCPPGTSSEGGNSSCLPCPPNTFNSQPEWACMPCGLGTSSLEGSRECVIGDATRPESFCTFTLSRDSLRTPAQQGQEGEEGKEGEEGQQEEEEGALPPDDFSGAFTDATGDTMAAVIANQSAAAVVFDLSPLSRMHPGRMFGPVLDAAAAAAAGGHAGAGGGGGGAQKGKGGGAGRQQAEYFFSVCKRDTSNDTCYDYSGQSLNTYACKVDPQEAIGGGLRPGHSLGSAVSVESLAAVHPALYRRGLVMALTGDECPQTNMPRETKVTFICDPAAGHGQPEAWTAEGQEAALNPALAYPHYVSREGAVQPIEQSDCSFGVVWYSLFACPLCTEDDYKRVEAAACMDDKRATFKWKTPTLCQLNPSHPLPPDEPCEPCQQGEIIRTVGDCADADGRHNVTFAWRQPHHCSATLPGAASLPAAELVGPCEQRLLYVASEALSPMWAALFVALGLCIVCFGSLSLMTWLRSRRLRQMYERLVEAEVQMEREMGDLHGDDDADVDADVEDTRQLTNGDS
ncbi:hypothetical protein CLOM_g1596 [Closterium sp. NIES-68]|nr:hypothetical protein CLOM_g1596 [Closterium sp. NIES-68]